MNQHVGLHDISVKAGLSPEGLMILVEFGKVDPDMPLQMAATFLVAAINEGFKKKAL